MSKKSATTIEMTIALLIVVVVVLVFVSYGSKIWELIKISIGFGKIDEPENKGDEIITPTSQIDQIAEDDYNGVVEFLQKLNKQSFITQCKTTFNFNDKYPINYFILIPSNGEIQLRGGEAGADKILKKESTNFIPYGDLSSDYNFNEYFKNYDKFKNAYLITASGGYVVPNTNEKPLIVQTKTIVAVSKDKKWFLTKPNSFIDNNNKFPDCYNIVT